MIQTLNEYIAEAGKAEQYIKTAIDKRESDSTLTSLFLRYRTNKKRFLPENRTKDLDFFIKTEVNLGINSMVVVNTGLPVLIEMMTISGDTAPLYHSSQKPYIFCTFHFGPFRMIGGLLAYYGHNIATLAAPGSFAHSQAADMEMLYSNSSSIMLEMMNHLKKGKSLKAFIDANEGLVTDKGSKNFTKINFLNHQLYAKKGIPYLAYLTNTPIIPILCYQESVTKTHVVLGKAIDPDLSITKEAFAQQTLQQLYDWFTPYLKEYPEQWKYWQSLHKYIESPVVPTTNTQDSVTDTIWYQFNPQRYEKFYINKVTYLFDKVDCISFAISNALSEYLNNLEQKSEKFSVLRVRLNVSLLTELITRQVLIAHTHQWK